MKKTFNMVINLEYFEKFIVKQIVNTVDYHPETDEYKINRIHISDDIINTIKDEGVRYGLKREQIGTIISKVAENIRTNPTLKLRYDSIDVEKFKIGQHLRINILHPEKGLHYLELLVINKLSFYVLSSNIGGINYGDILHAIDSIWNNGYYADFYIFKKNKKQSSEELRIRIGKIQNVEIFGPSVIHEILDSKSTFSYDSIKDSSMISTTIENKDRRYFFWLPTRWNPISFSWREGDVQDEMSPFIITDNENTQESKIIFNKAFQIPKDIKLQALIEIFFDCCKWKNAFNGIENLKYIKPVKAGIVKKTISDLGYKEWELINPPQIKFVYE